jgi:DNA modification methylase
MQVEMRPLSSIRPYENNPRSNDAGVDAVAASIRAFGFRQPLVVDEAGVIIVGHTRYKAALKLGLNEVPVHVAVGLSAAQAAAYRIADNQTAQLSEWDDEKLVQELARLREMDVDLGLTGFAPEDLTRLLDETTTQGLIDPDAIPEPPDAAITQYGDLWLLGPHRLLCGDSSKRHDVDRLLDGAPIHLIFTDPPYGVSVEPRSNIAVAAGLSTFEAASKHQRSLDRSRHPEKATTTACKLRARDRPLVNDFVSAEEFERLLQLWFGNLARALAPGRSFYIWGGYSNLPTYPPVLRAHGLFFSQAIVWNKLHPVISRKDFMGCFELAFYGWREGAAHRFYGPNNALDLWEVQKVNPQSMLHLTQKPVELGIRALQYSSQPGENVLDLFAGSGSTLIAAQQTGRRAFVMELDGLYCDIVVQRFEQFTGKKAERIRA